MRDNTLKEFNRLLKDNNQISNVLKNELAANTQATGKNTQMIDNVRRELKDLAKETGDWRKSDIKHHVAEDKKDQKKLEKMDTLISKLDVLLKKK